MSYETNVITPLSKLVIQLSPRLSTFLCQSSLSMRVEGNLIVLERKPGFWRFVPWYLSLVVVTGFVGLGSCLYVFLRYILDFRMNSTVKVPLFAAVVGLGLVSCGVSELVITFGAIYFHEFLPTFNQMIKLEQDCK